MLCTTATQVSGRPSPPAWEDTSQSAQDILKSLPRFSMPLTGRPPTQSTRFTSISPCISHGSSKSLSNHLIDVRQQLGSLLSVTATGQLLYRLSILPRVTTSHPHPRAGADATNATGWENGRREYIPANLHDRSPAQPATPGPLDCLNLNTKRTSDVGPHRPSPVGQPLGPMDAESLPSFQMRAGRCSKTTQITWVAPGFPKSLVPRTPVA